MRVLTFENMAINLSAAAFQSLTKEVRSLKIEESITELDPLFVERPIAWLGEHDVGSAEPLLVGIRRGFAERAPPLEIPAQLLELNGLERCRELVPTGNLVGLFSTLEMWRHQ